MSFLNRPFNRGYSLIEMLVVIAVFSVMAVIATQSLMLTFRSSRKTGAMINTQKDLRYALAVIERGLYNAESITSTCVVSGSTSSSIAYLDEWNQAATFSCGTTGGGVGFVASGSGQLTSTHDTDITKCQFTCTSGGGNYPDIIKVELTGVDLNTTGAEGSSVTISNTILLRSY